MRVSQKNNLSKIYESRSQLACLFANISWASLRCWVTGNELATFPLSYQMLTACVIYFLLPLHKKDFETLLNNLELVSCVRVCDWMTSDNVFCTEIFCYKVKVLWSYKFVSFFSCTYAFFLQFTNFHWNVYIKSLQTKVTQKKLKSINLN